MTDVGATDHYCVCNGATLRFRDEGCGPPIMLVHGWTLDLEMWNSQAAALRGDFRVVRFDRRGFGLSSGHPSIDRDCEDIEALCRHLALDRVALVGMSQGARAVMRFAVTAPQRVSCVVLDGPPDLINRDTTDFEALRPLSALARTEGIDAFRRAWVNHPLVSLRTDDSSARLALRRMIERYPGKDLTAAAVSPESGLSALHLQSFEVPTLIISGEHDVPDRLEAATALARRLPRAGYATVPHAGHLPNLDNSVTYNAILRSFLEQQSIAPT